ncbi:MAG: PIN domain-containing protein [Candidatus Micrarchaeota archaeon]
MRILDSSVLVAMYHDRDVHHSKAEELLKTIREDEPLILNDYLVNESSTVVLRKAGLERAKTMLATILENQQFQIRHTTEEEFGDIVACFKSQNSTLSFVDCSIICLSKAMGCRVETFDKTLQAEIEREKKEDENGR